MDTKKLDKWADLLLDTGKRNNLINFRDTKASTAEVLLPSAEVLFGKIDGTGAFGVYDPKIEDGEEDDEPTGSENAESPAAGQLLSEGTEALAGSQLLPESTEAPEGDLPLAKAGEALVLPEIAQTMEDGQPLPGTGKTCDTPDAKAEYLSLYAGKIRKQSQLLLYNAAAGPIAAVRNIDKKAREFLEETGVNVAYMAFGFIHWKENESSRHEFRAPILLVPIRLEQASAVDPYFMRFGEDEIIVNPTFSYKLEAEYGVKLPEYADEDLPAYLEKVRQLVSRLRWEVSSECKIGIFSFQKINMYRDLKDNAAEILLNRNVRQLLGEAVSDRGASDGIAESSPVLDPLLELHSVVDADSSQMEAIEMAKSGKSFVLQGPPGTGKSQTITNIIAECLSDGKKVLFVSEKMAALNVVYDKLKQAGLSEFCLELHSHKANKKDVIADICRTLKAPKTGVSSKADTEITIKEKNKRQLDTYAAELHRERPVIGKSLYQLYEAYAALRSAPEVKWRIPGLGDLGGDYLTEAVSLLEQYAAYVPTIGYDYRKNVWYGYIHRDTSYLAKEEVKENLSCAARMVQALIPLVKDMSSRYGITCSSLEEVKDWQRFFAFAAKSQLMKPALLKQSRFDAALKVLADLRRQSGEILESRAVLDACFDENIYKLDGAAYYKKLTKRYGGRFSRLFHSEYRQLIRDIRACKKNGKRVSYKEAVALTERLSRCQEMEAAFQYAETPVKGFMGPAYTGVSTDWSYVAEQAKALQEIFDSGISLDSLTGYSDFEKERESFAAYAEGIEQALLLCGDAVLEQVAGYFDRTVFDVNVAGLSLVMTRLNDCAASMDKADHWCHFRDLLAKLNNWNVVPFIHAAIARDVRGQDIAQAFKKQFYGQWIDLIISATPVLSSFNRISQDQAVRTFAEKDLEQFEINKAKIRADLSAQRPSVDMIASGSALATLLREGEKKRRQKSIRTLLTQTGELIQRLKPCFLMSPLSVSTFLTAGAVHFDVVVFDEASQIFPQDAIGAIYRADQLIVVGDSRQMPPSNFFHSTVEVEDDDEETGDVTDFESILDLCSVCMQQLRLRWHYRSRYEQLITFSNQNFYDNDLVTFPSAKADEAGVGVDYYHVDGVFDRKSHTNRREAEYVVDLIYENIEKYPDRSLGVVAFSVAQQDLIDRLLSKRRRSTPEKEFFFKQSEKEPFFVKNLETVQGDERDTIIFSVAYGVDAQGRLYHNFGPLNRVGGERWLNVAVTRAKYNVQVVSSMHCTDIDLKHTSSEGARLLREYLDFAENGSIALERSLKVNAFEQFDSDFELEVCGFLRENGFSVDTQVGCSGFRIDLGLKKPDSSDYVLAIECDGATYHSSKNARDRDRLRQEILERMGWKFYRIWSTDWFKNQTIEKQRLLEAANEAVQSADRMPPPSPEKDKAELSFEETPAVTHFAFPAYKAADIDRLSRQYLPRDFKGFVKAILQVEAPLSEELLLKRIVWYFGKEKVTGAVQKEYEHLMIGYQRYGIVRRSGFLYLANIKTVSFRGPGDIEREIKQIAPEELAAGMLEILKQNVTVEKSGLYRTLALQCGVSRAGKAIGEYFDSALRLLANDIYADGEQITLKQQ